MHIKRKTRAVCVCVCVCVCVSPKAPSVSTRLHDTTSSNTNDFQNYLTGQQYSHISGNDKTYYYSQGTCSMSQCKGYSLLYIHSLIKLN
jgi:hypothetical protein